MIMRDESAVDSSPLVSDSIDSGATWSTPISLTGIKMGKNPPGLFHNPDTDRISLIWSSRGPSRNPSGGQGMYWPWYITQAIGSDVMGVDKWRSPVAISVTSPEHGGPGGGDSGYHHIFAVRGRTYMSFYRGDGFGTSPSGTDIFLANMDLICGWL